MDYAIIGAGAIGTALAGHFARTGTAAVIASRGGPESLATLVEGFGHEVRAAPTREALSAAIVILAVPYDAVAQALADAPAWEGRVLVDATNAIDFPGFKARDLGGELSTRRVAALAPGARVVKAFNTIPAAVLAADPRVDGARRRVVMLSGDDPAANAAVARLVAQLDFAPLDLGPLEHGGPLQSFGGPLPGLDLALKR